MLVPLVPFVILTLFILQTHCQGDFSCDSSRPCSNGACCGPSGFCGYGPDFCGTGCVSNCNAHAECGQFAVTPNLTCPLNVCCSQFGFCGTTSDFCGTGCQNGCSTPTPKKCSGENSALQRIIGYYESWATARPCSAWWPEQLNPNAYTHINFAFASIDGDSFSIVPASASDVDLYTRTTALKQFNPDLKVFISVGGWAFNDPPTQNIFSDLSANSNNRQAFIKSLISFFQTYAFDGVDIDWEYPVAPERGGSPQDKENFVTLLRELRMAFDSSSQKYGLTITIPSSYWYLQNFDIISMSQYVDWFNAMEYDLHGTWDGTDPFIGPVVNAHSNLTEIEQSFDLLWRNGIDPSKVVMGLGFYGRSFQLASPSCSSPECNFAGPANAGPCTGSPGTLSYSEIQDIISENSLTPTWDHTAAVKYIVWNNNQWVSYDDQDTFGQKLEFANNLCLGGVMVWSADQDDSVGTAISSLAGNAPQFESLMAKSLSTSFLTGQTCTVTDCGANCEVGFTELALTKGKPTQPTYNCKKGQSRKVCCPSNAVPTGCTWRGSAPFCDGQCHVGEQTLFYDNSGDGHSCWTGKKALCCPVNQDELSQCSWSGTAPFCNGKCSTSGNTQLTFGRGGQGNGDYCFTGKKVLCCPDPAPYTNCSWFGTAPLCDGKCPINQVQLYTDSSGTGDLCLTGQKVFCCNPPGVAVDPTVEMFKEELAAFLQNPTCNVADEVYDRRRAVTPDTLSSSSLDPFGVTTVAVHLGEQKPRVAPVLAIGAIISGLVSIFLGIAAQSRDSPNVVIIPLSPTQMGIQSTFNSDAGSNFGNANLTLMSLRYSLMTGQPFLDDGPPDIRSDAQDMLCEGENLGEITTEVLLLTASACIWDTAKGCNSVPSNCGSSNSKRADANQNSFPNITGPGHWNTTIPLFPRYFDQQASKASGSTGTNSIRPNVFDVVNAIINGELPLLEFSLFNSGGPGNPDIQVEVVFDIRGHRALAEFPATQAGSANGFDVDRDPDNFLIIHFHLAPPTIGCVPENRVNVKAMNMWHAQHTGVGINSDAVPFPEVGGRDKQKKKPRSWGANQRFKLLNCATNQAWPVELCPRPLPVLTIGGTVLPNPTGDNLARANLIYQLVQYLIEQNILVWDFIEWMWDDANGSWFDDDMHRRGPRYGPGGGAAGALNRGPSQLPASS